MRVHHRPLHIVLWGVPLLLFLLSPALPTRAESGPDPRLAAVADTSQALAALASPTPHFGYNDVAAQVATPPGQAGKECIRHMTGSTRNPSVLIEVSPNAVPAHLAHGDQDLGPAPCPQ
jgi:hypothetical protein